MFLFGVILVVLVVACASLRLETVEEMRSYSICSRVGLQSCQPMLLLRGVCSYTIHY